MKNNDLNGNQEFEKLLKDKMNELSSSVDCFDRISAKAFPEKNSDFYESGFVVCDLENITGKSKKLPFLKWTAGVIACVLCVAVIPKSAFFNNMIANFSRNSKKTYNRIIDEINSETAKNSYRIYDIPLDDYIKYDKLVTPLYDCPFEDCGKDNVNVRIFVRTYNDIPTNQIYAVEYMDEYIQSNFIAVADSKAKFTDKDFESIDSEVNASDWVLNEAVKVNFTPAITAESYIMDKNENKVSLASFEYESIFKSGDEVQKIVSQVLYYGDRIDEEPEKYYYDINNTPDIKAEGAWKNSVCFDGFTAMPEENKSLFIKTSLFNGETSDENSIAYTYITPENITDVEESDITGIDYYSLGLHSFSESDISVVAVPYDTEILKTLKMYFSQSGIIFSSASDTAVVFTSRCTELTEVITVDDENYHQFPTAEEENEQRRIEAENAILNAEDERYSELAEQAEIEHQQIEAEKAKEEQSTRHYEFKF
ncbi:MAG: hypothetical protein K2I06_04155 [Ruminococcus sp.]|nr:hypothetical protein [Ruminococcus sp.]